uniref:Protein serine/threonine phosphatase 2C C-terminal domain-containing protein n=1 Tax=Chelydra serpentina TaxID=8475 RepID=A0A8C3SL49_CHESE
MTCMVVCFRGAPGTSQAALQKERELDAHLESRVQQDQGAASLVAIFRCLASEVNPSLPPGGGLASKRAVIKEAYERLRRSYEAQMLVRTD